MIAYVQFRGDLSFGQSPFCDIDAMVLSQLSSVDYTGVVPGAENVDKLAPSKRENCPTIAQVAELMTEEQVGYAETNPEVIALLKLVGASKRFGHIRMDAFIRDTREDKVKQFSAVTFYLDWRTRFIAFRGTDGYVVSWKENFNMNYMFPVPSQTDAVTYLTRMAPGFLGQTMVGGHSKGGNLAVYAATFAEEKLQKKIKRIYAFDAPGYKVDLSQEESFLRIKEKITSYIPRSSAVGRMFLVPYEQIPIVSDGIGAEQHSMFQWHVVGTELEAAESTDQFSQDAHDVVAQWRTAIPEHEMKRHIDSLFDIFARNGIAKSDQLHHMDGKQVLRIMVGTRSIAPEDRTFLITVIRLLWGEKLGEKIKSFENR